MSYADLHDGIVRVASALSRLGLGKNDVITIVAPNSIEWCIMYLGASLTGAIVSAVNPLYTAGNNMSYILFVNAEAIRCYVFFTGTIFITPSISNSMRHIRVLECHYKR